MPAPLAPAHTFGRRLREARLARADASTVGAVLGLDEENSAAPRVSRYERDRVPDPATMEKLAQALGMPVAISMPQMI